MRVSASLKPSARRIAAWRSPSALRISDCFWPSATLIADCRAPSDSVMTARRVRSAESCRFIESWTSRGGVISRISTRVILPPQLSVISSSFVRRTSLIWSRFESTSSSRMSPTTARRVVVARPCEGAREVLDVHDALERLDDPPVDQEVDGDRRVVLGDRRLAGHLDELLAQVDLARPVDERDEEHEARALDQRFVGVAQPVDDQLLAAVHDPDREPQDRQQDQDDRDDESRAGAAVQASTSPLRGRVLRPLVRSVPR